MKILLLASVLLFSALIIFSCKKDNPIPPENQPQINLSLADTSCTEVWLKLTTKNVSLPAEVILKQDDSVAQTISLSIADTSLYVDSLLPNHTYKFHTVIQPYNHTGDFTSDSLNVTTMDTMSHNFTFQTWTFGGQAGSCTLYDVAIINENDIWAVGQIYLLDSTGVPDPTRYNLAVWDGINWEIKRVPYLYQGQPFYNPIQSVFVFGANDIWFCGNGVIHWDGNQYNPVPVPTNVWGPYQMNKILGTSSNDIYVVGNSGSIAHYQNGQWSRTESGTDVDFYDVWGDQNGTVWICGYSDDYGTSVLLRYTKDDGIESVYSGLSNSQNNGFYIGPISGVWETNEFRIYMMNWSGIYIQANSTRFYLQKEIARFNSAGYGIDGMGNNNIFACGEGFVGHWNGVNYIEYPEVYREYRTFNSVKVKSKIVSAGGFDYNGYIYSQAVIAFTK